MEEARLRQELNKAREKEREDKKRVSRVMNQLADNFHDTLWN